MALITTEERSRRIEEARKKLEQLDREQESLYTEIGRAALAAGGIEAFPQYAESYRALEEKFREARQALSNAEALEAEDPAPAPRRCPRCGRVAASENEMFCILCGTRMASSSQPHYCTNCGHELLAGAWFCTNCGQKAR